MGVWCDSFMCMRVGVCVVDVVNCMEITCLIHDFHPQAEVVSMGEGLYQKLSSSYICWSQVVCASSAVTEPPSLASLILRLFNDDASCCEYLHSNYCGLPN